MVGTTSPARENIETVRRAYAALNERDIDAALALFAEDFVNDWSRSVGPYAGVYKGHAATRRFFAAFLEAVEELRFEIEDLREIGPHVLVMTRAHVRGIGSGAEAVGRGPHLWTLADGEVTRFTLFQDEAEAIASASQ